MGWKYLNWIASLQWKHAETGLKSYGWLWPFHAAQGDGFIKDGIVGVGTGDVANDCMTLQKVGWIVWIDLSAYRAGQPFWPARIALYLLRSLANSADMCFDIAR
jgi:hypothetical protein